MNRKKIPTYVGIFLLTWALFFLLNYLLLKNTAGGEGATADSSVAVDSLDPLRLTWDISGQSLPPEQELTRIEERHREQKQELQGIVDSLLARETTPLKEDVKQAKEDMESTKKQVSEMEELLATISSQADSIDMVKAKRLSRMLEGMKSDKAAAILTQLSSRVNAELLLKMRQRNAAKILAELPQERAAEVARLLSEAYARSSI